MSDKFRNCTYFEIEKSGSSYALQVITERSLLEITSGTYIGNMVLFMEIIR